MKKELFYILKRVIIGVFIAVILFSIKSCQVHASTYNYDLYDGLTLPPYNKIRYIGIGANETYTERTLADHMDSDLITRFFWIDGLYNDANGFSFAWLNDFVFVPNNLYNIAVLYCTTSGTVINGYRQFAVGTGTSFTTATTNATYNENNSYILQKDYSNLGAYYTDSTDFHTCLLASMQFRANNAGNVVAVKYWNTNGRVSMGTLAYMGYILDNQGQDFNVFKDQIISNITSSQNAIINNQNSNRQLIINNQNSNTQQIISEQQNTTQAVEDLNDSITSEVPPNLTSLNNSAGWLPPGPVDSILNLPLALLNNINTNLSKTCQPVILHIPLVDRDLPIPCITTLYEQMGIMTWVNTIGAIASAFILFSYFVKLYKWVDDTLTFRENNYIDNWGGV